MLSVTIDLTGVDSIVCVLDRNLYDNPFGRLYTNSFSTLANLQKLYVIECSVTHFIIILKSV